MEIYKWHLFYLRTWRKKVKELCRNPQWYSPNYKLYCRVVTEINQFFGCYSFSDRRPNRNRFMCLQIASHQYIHSSSCYPYHCKKSIPRSQALCIKRICSKNNFFDIHLKKLEKWLIEKRYSEKLGCKEIVKARSQWRETLLDKKKCQEMMTW